MNTLNTRGKPAPLDVGPDVQRVAVTFEINRAQYAFDIEPWTTLLDLLHEHCGLTGTRKGCDHGQCGACTALVGGERINTCLALAAVYDGASITTIEGLADGDLPDSGAPDAGSNALQAAASGAAMRDPRSLYPHPPFPEQQQPWPGLAARMTPRPDRGESSYRGSGLLAGRKALITGGDSGIGRAVAIAFAREGADVSVVYLPAEEPDAQEVVQLVRSAGRHALPLPGDIRDEAFCKQAVERAANGMGGLDILVNNAGRQHSHDSILDISTEEFDWTLRTNLYGMFWITKAAIPHMPAGAAIVNTSSVNAYDPSINLVDYAMTKAAIANFTKSLAKQLVVRGIRVNAVAPGPFWTPLQVSGGQTMKNVVDFGAKTPMGRPGQPAEIAPVYVELAAARSSYVTGQVYGASGGEGSPDGGRQFARSYAVSLARMA